MSAGAVVSAQRERVVQRWLRHNAELAASRWPKGGIVYEAEDVVGMRTNEEGERQFLVKWKEFEESYNSWEPEREFVTNHLIKQYLSRDAAGKDERKGGEREDAPEEATTTIAMPTLEAAVNNDDTQLQCTEQLSIDETATEEKGGGDPVVPEVSNSNAAPPAVTEVSVASTAKRPFESTAESGPSKKGKLTVGARLVVDGDASSSAPSLQDSQSAATTKDSPPRASPYINPSNVVITPALAAQLVMSDDFEDIMMDCFAWKSHPKQPLSLVTVVGFIRRRMRQYEFVDRVTDVYLLVREKWGTVCLLKFTELVNLPLTQSFLDDYRAKVPQKLAHGWSQEWIAAKDRQINEFLSRTSARKQQTGVEL